MENIGDWIPLTQSVPGYPCKIALMQADNGVILSIVSNIELEMADDCFGIPRFPDKLRMAEMLRAFTHWKPQ